jgi:hypothetical protein
MSYMSAIQKIAEVLVSTALGRGLRKTADGPG